MLACLKCGARELQLYAGRDAERMTVALHFCKCGSYAPIQLTRSLRLVWDANFAEKGCEELEPES